MSKLRNVIRWRKDMGDRVYNLMLLEALQETFIQVDFVAAALETFGFVLADENDFRKAFSELQEFSDYIKSHDESKLTTFEDAIFKKMGDLLDAKEKAEEFMKQIEK